MYKVRFLLCLFMMCLCPGLHSRAYSTPQILICIKEPIHLRGDGREGCPSIWGFYVWIQQWGKECRCFLFVTINHAAIRNCRLIRSCQFTCSSLGYIFHIRPIWSHLYGASLSQLVVMLFSPQYEPQYRAGLLASCISYNPCVLCVSSSQTKTVWELA